MHEMSPWFDKKINIAHISVKHQLSKHKSMIWLKKKTHIHICKAWHADRIIFATAFYNHSYKGTSCGFAQWTFSIIHIKRQAETLKNEFFYSRRSHMGTSWGFAQRTTIICTKRQVETLHKRSTVTCTKGQVEALQELPQSFTQMDIAKLGTSRGNEECTFTIIHTKG